MIGALNGIAIAMEKPRTDDVMDPRKYDNRKELMAVVVQAVSTAEFTFLYLSTKHAGCSHDLPAFHASNISRFLYEETVPS